MESSSSASRMCQVLDVHRENFSGIWPSLKLAVINSTFVAVDLEMSGLGNRRQLSNHCLEERYATIADAARTRSILSIGVSCFKDCKLDESDTTAAQRYSVQTYNLLVLCAEPYTVEPESLKFLNKHGFDFNKQYSLGLPYRKGTIEDSDVCYKQPSLRLLFQLLLLAGRPLVLHNGLVDLVFLYHNLYLDLPKKLSTFLADVEDMFPAGVFDTKYITEYHVQWKKSYLQFAFSCCVNWNAQRKHPLQFLSAQFPGLGGVTEFDVTSARPLANLSHQRNPARGAKRRLSGGTNAASAKRRSKKQAKRSRTLSDADSTDSADVDDNELPRIDRQESQADTAASCDAPCNRRDGVDITSTQLQCHRAGIDALMTGICFACYCTRLDQLSLHLSSVRNHLYLSGKDTPLLVTKGNFGRVSALHSSNRPAKSDPMML